MTTKTQISIDPDSNDFAWREVDEFLFVLKTVILCFDPTTTFEGVHYAISNDLIDIVNAIKSRLEPDLWHDVNEWLQVIEEDEQLRDTFRNFLEATGLSERMQKSIYVHLKNTPEEWLLPIDSARSLVGIKAK